MPAITSRGGGSASGRGMAPSAEPRTLKRRKGAKQCAALTPVGGPTRRAEHSRTQADARVLAKPAPTGAAGQVSARATAAIEACYGPVVSVAETKHVTARAEIGASTWRLSVELIVVAIAATVLGGCSSCGDRRANPRADEPAAASGARPFHTSWDGGRRHRLRLRTPHGPQDGGGERSTLPEEAPRP